MNIIESYLTNNPCYTANQKIKVKGIMLHSVACAQPSASVFINTWNKASYNRACVHAFIDANTGDVYQTLPWNHRGWHCGKGSLGSANNTHIGIEMCEPANLKYLSNSIFTCSDSYSARAAVRKTYQSAVELFAFLCKQYSLDPLEKGVIISHKEGSDLGIASSSGDPEHLWYQLQLTEYNMDLFRQDVAQAMKQNDNNTNTILSWLEEHGVIQENSSGLIDLKTPFTKMEFEELIGRFVK